MNCLIEYLKILDFFLFFHILKLNLIIYYKNMKISYNVLKKYIPQIKKVEEIARDLVMHTAEVEEIQKI